MGRHLELHTDLKTMVRQGSRIVSKQEADYF